MLPALLLSTPAGRRWAALAAALTAAALGAGLLLTVTGAGLLASTISVTPKNTGLAGADCPPDTVQGGDTALHLTKEQNRNAATIIRVGRQMHIPTRGHVVAIATALQESQLTNIHGGDRDSQGLFQQRPSMGWGTAAQITDPAYAAAKFYSALKGVPGWQQMSITRAAQTVQKSAFPDAYAKHERRSVAIVKKLGGKSADLSGCTPTTNAPNAATARMLRAALAQKGKPYVWGATGPDAFDCSGLIVWAWKQAGYRLTTRISQDQHRIATPIKSGQERPGDLLFSAFDEQEGVPGAAHVLLVVKPGTAIEAPRPGKSVRVRHYDTKAEGMRIGRLPASALTATK